MRISYSIVFLFISINAFSQFGIRAKYNSNNFTDLNRMVSPLGNNDLLTSSLELGVDYWLRLKNKRIEFYPEVSYERKKDNTPLIGLTQINYSAINFQLNTNLYLLDFTGDCDCPTFSKQSQFFSKGFHVIASPGVKYYSFKGDDETSSDSGITWSIALGAGIDIGVNDLLTITPFIMYRISPSLKWGVVSDLVTDPMAENFNLDQFQVGIRFGFRPDYVAPRFGR